VKFGEIVDPYGGGVGNHEHGALYLNSIEFQFQNELNQTRKLPLTEINSEFESNFEFQQEFTYSFSSE